MSKYLTVGTDELKKDYFKNITVPRANYSFKPDGGLWACNTDNSLCDYLYYKQDKGDLDLGELPCTEYSKGCLITLKEDSKIYKIESREDVVNLSQLYPSFFHESTYIDKEILENRYPIDYAEMSEDYDGIYVDLSKLPREMTADVDDWYYIQSEFQKFECSSLVLFNLDAIDHYNSVSIVSNNYILEIDSMSEDKEVIDMNSYSELYDEVKDLFDEEMDNLNVDSYFEYVEAAKKIAINLKQLVLREEDTDKKLLDTVIHNITDEYMRELQSVDLHVKRLGIYPRF